MDCRVRAIVHPGQNLCYASYAYAGLAMLAAANEITLTLGGAQDAWCKEPHENIVLRLEVTGSDHRRRKVCIDFHDRADRFAASALEWCDVYFKRSFYPPELAAISGDRAEKVRPFGLTYPCADKAIRRRLFRTWSWRQAKMMLGSPARFLREFRPEYHELKKFMTSPAVAAFEYAPTAPTDPAVLFQTRVWDAAETSDAAEQINAERADTVRVLRAALQGAFRGGLVPTRFAEKTFPDLVTHENTRREDYVASGKKPLVGVYTRGLHHSLAFKLAEYLAAGKCIVMPALRNLLPEPLIPDVHYLPFQTADECVSQCRALLADPARASAMRAANSAYYQECVHPAARMRKCLAGALDSPPRAHVPAGKAGD